LCHRKIELQIIRYYEIILLNFPIIELKTVVLR